MAFITEIPSTEDIEKWQIKHFLHNDYTKWTIDRDQECFLILFTESNKDNIPQEDYYFCHADKIGLISIELHLEHDKDEPNILIYHFKVVCSYGLDYNLRRDPQFRDDKAICPFSSGDSQSTSQLLQQAFIAYKSAMGLSSNSTQKVIIDTSLLCNKSTK